MGDMVLEELHCHGEGIRVDYQDDGWKLKRAQERAKDEG
jgi:hypothetical protein